MNVDGGSKLHDAFFIWIFESPANHGRHIGTFLSRLRSMVDIYSLVYAIQIGPN